MPTSLSSLELLVDALCAVPPKQVLQLLDRLIEALLSDRLTNYLSLLQVESLSLEVGYLTVVRAITSTIRRKPDARPCKYRP